MSVFIVWQNSIVDSACECFPGPACLPPEGTDMLIESQLAVLPSEMGVSVFVPMTSLFSVIDVQLFQRGLHIWTTCCITAGNLVLLQNYI